MLSSSAVGAIVLLGWGGLKYSLLLKQLTAGGALLTASFWATVISVACTIVLVLAWALETMPANSEYAVGAMAVGLYSVAGNVRAYHAEDVSEAARSLAVVVVLVGQYVRYQAAHLDGVGSVVMLGCASAMLAWAAGWAMVVAVQRSRGRPLL